MKNNHFKGFTLIELSIVLVIVALLVGGILVGRDLIAASYVRAQVSQIEQISTSIMAFKNKYNCIPGDCANATSFFSGVSNGNGDGVTCTTAIGACATANTNAGQYFVGNWVGAEYEIASIFDHLAAAGLSELGQFNETDSTVSHYAGIGFPRMKMKPSGIPVSTSWVGPGGIAVHYMKAWQYMTEGYKLTLGACDAASAIFGFYCGFNALDAYTLDAKMDDGKPLSGKMMIQGMLYVYRVPGDVNNEVGGSCTPSGSVTDNQYNTDTVNYPNGNNQRCVPSVQLPI